MNLVEIWSNPKNLKMARQQVCARLPICTQARIDALAKIFGRSRSDIICDLLAAGLEVAERELLRKRNMTPEELDDYEDHLGHPIDEDDSMPKKYVNSKAFHYLREVESFEKSLIDDSGSSEKELYEASANLSGQLDTGDKASAKGETENA